MTRRKTPKLVTQYLENISREAFHLHLDVVRKFVGNRTGIYALFSGGELYYVGLASDLRHRLKSHLSNRHGKAWDTFSVYLTIGDQHLRELESLILRIALPAGNRQRGKFAGAHDVRRVFYNEIGMKQRLERDRIFGFEPYEKYVRELLPKARSIQAMRSGKRVRARLLRDFSVRWNGMLYGSPSGAASAVCGRRKNGWRFWLFERSPGDWVRIDALRDR